MVTPASYAAIAAAAREQIDVLNAIDKKLHLAMIAIQRSAGANPLNADQMGQLQQLRLQDKTVVDSRTEIARVTLSALDSAPELAGLIASIKHVNDGLAAKKAALEKFANNVAEFANLLQGITSLVTKLVGVAGEIAAVV